MENEAESFESAVNLIVIAAAALLPKKIMFFRD